MENKDGGSYECATPVSYAGDSIQGKLLWIGFIFIGIGCVSAFWNRNSNPRSDKSEASAVVTCADSKIIHIDWQIPIAASKVSGSNCWTEPVFVPWSARYLIDGVPGTTEVCFWLNNRCEEIRMIHDGDNLDWKSAKLKYRAMRFRGNSGKVLVRLIGRK